MTRTDFQPSQASVGAERIGARARPADRKGEGAGDAPSDDGFPRLLSNMAATGHGRADQRAASQEAGVVVAELCLPHDMVDQVVLEAGAAGAASRVDGLDLGAAVLASAPVDVVPPSGAPSGTADLGAFYRADRMLGASFLAGAVVDAAADAAGHRGAPEVATTDAGTENALPGFVGMALALPDRAAAVAERVAPQAARFGMETAAMPRAAAEADLAPVGAPLPAVAVLRQETHLAPARMAAPAAPAVVVVGTQGLATDAKAVPSDSKDPPRLENRRPASGAMPVAAAPELPAGPGTVRSPLPDRAFAAPVAPVDAADAQDLAAGKGAATVEQALPVVGEEVQLAAQLPSSPARQVADRLVAAVLTGSEPHKAATAPLATASTAHTVKVLYLQLQPAELGIVTVRMALRNDAIEIQLEAGRQDTALLLQRDSEAISSALRTAGYQVDAMVVRVAAPTAAADGAPVSTGASVPDTATQSQPGTSQSNGRAADGRAHPQQQLDRAPTSRSDSHEDGSTASRAGSGLYV